MSFSSFQAPSSGPGYSFAKEANSGFREHRFNPYTDNGGSILGIAGEDFVVLAGDTRSTSGYNINSRTQKKVFSIGGYKNSLVIATVGFGADARDLVEKMKRAVEDYKFAHNLREMSVSAAAQQLHTLLYGNRFFPKYAYCVLGGIDSSGKARLYSYDPIGSYSKEGESRAAAGAASSLIVPFLDNQVEFKNQHTREANGDFIEKAVHPLPLDHVLKLVKDAFTSATERHIEVGDGLQLVVVTAANGVNEQIVPLKED